MAQDSLRILAILPTSPERIYAAWLDAREHTEFTGGKATVEPRVGGKHTAWDDYISGTTIELVPGRRIVQTWRTTEFPDEAPDSRLELLFEPRGGGAETTLTLIHTEIPAGQGPQYKDGWAEHYFEPMRAYFSEATKRSSPKPGHRSTKAAAATERSDGSAAKKKGAPAKPKPSATAQPGARRKPAAKAEVAVKKATPERAGATKPSPKKTRAKR